MNHVLSLLKAAVFYFGIVFATGFILGTIRVFLLQPAIGERGAELAEMPIMLLVIYFAARFIAAKFSYPKLGTYLAVGILSLALMLLFEFTFVLTLRDMTIGEYLVVRDPVSGMAYLVSLVIYALMPVGVVYWGRRG